MPGGSVTGNDKVWRRFTFASLTTSKIRVHVTNVAGDNHSNVVEIEAYGPANVAAASNGAVATASSTYPTVVAGHANNGDHVGTASWWADDTSNSYPDWIQVEFAGSKTIGEIDVYGVQQNYNSPVEPAATLTSSYALTNFEVQYWTGSAWATVPGGSVTGNDKVWRKFTFAPLTTSKIRVHVTYVAGDNHSNVVELEAYTATASAATIQWLVSDHLGTPRMIFDQTGDLAKVKRHDYLPFGEELFAGTGGRSAANGYGCPSGQQGCTGDQVRQQFTLKERDIETGLDYFKARYYSSTGGRFVSVDPITITPYRLANPQALNGYSYVANMPLRFTDPTGKKIQFKTEEEAKQAVAYYRNGLKKGEQKFVSYNKNKDGTISLKVNEKAGKGADESSLLGRLYKAATADPVAVISLVKKADSFSYTVPTSDGKTATRQTSLGQHGLAGITLLPIESSEKATPKTFAPPAYSTEPNKTQLIIATDPAVSTPTQAIYAETLAHFGEFIRTGNAASATHGSSKVTEIEIEVVDQIETNQKTNTVPKKPD